jgi:hypothetical protein
VKAGTCIGEIDFHGLPHIHLTKVFSQGGQWGAWCYVCPPNGHFTYTDEESPVIRKPFYFFKNNSNEIFEPDPAGTVTVKGDVDIVVAMREAGLYARSNDSGFGDRLGVAGMEYAITFVSEGPKGTRQFPGFDFAKIRIKKGYHGTAYATKLTRAVYKHWRLFDEPGRSGDKCFSYYVLTNCPIEGCPKEVELDDEDYCWRTAEKDEKGNPLYPDGRYSISVVAWDFKGNRAVAEMEVKVINGGF